MLRVLFLELLFIVSFPITPVVPSLTELDTAVWVLTTGWAGVVDFAGFTLTTLVVRCFVFFLVCASVFIAVKPIQAIRRITIFFIILILFRGMNKNLMPANSQRLK